MAWVALLALLLPAAAAMAQAPSPQERQLYPQQELDRLLAPIALYPDSLLSQVLMAATYPLEVVQAARWSRSNPGISGDDAVRAVDNMDWDPSVKSMVAFPQVLAEMDEKLDWTQRLGEAFIGHEQQVMQAVQELRRKAQAAGNLRSDNQVVVQQQGTDILIDSPVPDVVYVPYYDPRVAYGPWWWPDAPPVYWGPWMGYTWWPGYPGYVWGPGVFVGGGFFYGGFNWRQHSVYVSDRRPFYYHGADHRPINAPGNQWRHDPDHRHGVPYRSPNLQQQYGGWSAPPQGRQDYRGRDPLPPIAQQGSRPPPAVQPAQQGFFAPKPDQRPGTNARPAAPASNARPAAPAPNAPNYRAARPVPEPRPNALEGVGRGQQTRDYSARGQQSMSSRPQAPGAVAPVQRAPPPGQANKPSGGAPASHPQGQGPVKR